jgi:hypothetical protein
VVTKLEIRAIELVDEQPVEYMVVCLLNHDNYFMTKGLQMSLHLMEVMKWCMMWNRLQKVFVMLLMKQEGWSRRILNLVTVVVRIHEASSRLPQHCHPLCAADS